MRRIIGTGSLVLGLTLFAVSPLAADRVCTVADPTGTPLNVRESPNGAILSTIGNGWSVRVLEERRVKGKLWMRILADGEEKGWVFGAYLDCGAGGTKSSPVKPRTPPG